MYYEYWGLQKAPFDNVPDPSMYVESHSSVENAIAETVFAIEEGNECIAVIVGDIGSGKTLSLRLILDSLDQDKYRIAFVTNPDMTFVQLLREIIGQITGSPCELKSKVDLLERFNKLLFEASDEGKKVLVFIDEANALAPRNLESLRLLTNMQDDSRNLFTMVLAGQMELARRLEHPSRANLFQRIGTYNRIDKIESVARLKDYVETRVRLAGGESMPFGDDAIDALWEHSDHGVPRLVNKVCKLCLKAGETNGFQVIDGETVNRVGERFQKQIGPVEGREARARKTARADEEPTRAEQPAPPASAAGPEEARFAPERTGPSEDEDLEPGKASWETDVGPFRMKIAIPYDLLQEAGVSTSEKRAKIARSLAAQTLQEYSQQALSCFHDPVALWGDVTKSILTALNEYAEVADGPSCAASPG